MLRRALAGLVLIGSVCLFGCGGDSQKGGSAMPVDKEVKLLIETLNKPNQSRMGMQFGVSRLGDLGPAAKEAIPTLQQLRAVAPPEFQATIDKAIAKIEGTAPVTPPSQ